SITNKEYEEAVKDKIPVFALVERNVWSDHFVYQKNKKNGNADSIVYPNVDNIKIFEFIDEVRKSENNNAIYPFGDFRDIEQYLKKQWAGLLYNFLTNSIETKKVKDLFEEIHSATEKIEYYTKQVALNVGDAHTNILIKCYDIMLGNEAVENLKGCWGIDLSPQIVISEESIDELCDNNIVVNEQEGNVITLGGPPYTCSRTYYEHLKEEYEELRDIMLNLLQEENVSVEEFLKIV
ncbi:MAG: hypothetical protein K2I21_02910, partial [Acetatifactor sp.]|nr:hypothetical protein [Acetatifactor sp.]